MEIGEIMRDLRKYHHMSQAKLASLLFVSQDTISLWELGKSKPDIDSIIRLTKIFGVTADYLLGLED